MDSLVEQQVLKDEIVKLKEEHNTNTLNLYREITMARETIASLEARIPQTLHVSTPEFDDVVPES